MNQKKKQRRMKDQQIIHAKNLGKFTKVWIKDDSPKSTQKTIKKAVITEIQWQETNEILEV